MKKSSKIIITLLVIILVAILGVGGYLIATLNKEVSEQKNEIAGLKNETGNSAEVESVVEGNSTVNSVESPEENVENNKVAESALVTDYVNEEIPGFEGGICKLPKINLESSDVKKINNEIKDLEEKYRADLKEYESVNGEKGSYAYANISYVYAVNDNVLSVVIAIFSNFNDQMDYKIYNICLAETEYHEEELTNENILEIAGVEKSEAAEKIDEIMNNEFSTPSDGNYEYYFNGNGDLCAKVAVDPEKATVDIPDQLINVSKEKVIDDYSEFLGE